MMTGAYEEVSFAGINYDEPRAIDTILVSGYYNTESMNAPISFPDAISKIIISSYLYQM